MGRGGKANTKSNFEKRVGSRNKNSNDSDEDYVVSDEEENVSDNLEDYCSSLDGEVSEESFGSYVEEEEVRKLARSKPKASAMGCRKTAGKTSRKRKRVSYDEEKDNVDDNDNNDDDDDDYVEEDEKNDNDDDDDDDDDEEFAPDEDDCFDDVDELTATKKKQNKKVRKQGLNKKGPVRGQKRRRKSVVPKTQLRKRRRNRLGSRRKARNDDDSKGDFIDMDPVVSSKSKKNIVWRKKRYMAQSDSDFFCSEASDYEYTISEEEREQIREANELCRNITDNVRTLSSSKKTQENIDMSQQRKLPKRKGKEKIEEVKNEVGKQVCGICLSEEDKRRVQGTLDCCSHYFCFSCIMEWSKVESRCPLCKQRFKTISKPARLSMAIDLRDVVIQVPKRDQVYQPSEEEIRGYMDPYENVICTECHHGGDDGLMLLCDFCDSPAHTYCVGLGREVPEGNWYCEGCKPIAIGSSSSQAQDLFLDQRVTSNNFSNRPSQVPNVRESFDLNSMPSPQTPSAQGFALLSSPRHPIADVQMPGFPPVSVAGAPTLSGRRWIHRHIQNILSLNRVSMAGRTVGISASNSSRDYLNSQTHLGRETVIQPTRTEDIRTYPSFFAERSQNNPSPSLPNRDILSSRLSHVRGQVLHDPTTTATDGSVNGNLWAELAGIDSISGFHQLQQSSSRSIIGSDANVSPYASREDSHLHVAKNELQSTVRSHLKILTTDIDLGHNTFKDIARSSTHTILAACGFEHRTNEIYPLLTPPVCSHGESLMAGHTSLLKGCCSSCFDLFVRDVVKSILNSKLPQWLVGSRT